jgi:S-sulfosulfanyl-L-cysteine sulfohydrolase
LLTRRDVLEVMAVAAIATGLGPGLPRAAAQQTVRQEDLLRFTGKGQVTLLHLTDCHAQLEPLYLREPSVNVGVGEAKGMPPHLTDTELLARFNMQRNSVAAYCYSSVDFETLARTYGRVGGFDRIATLVKAIRADRGADRVLLLDGGDALQGSYTALASKGGDMVRVMEALGVDATTGHWEFTLGAERIAELFGDRASPGSARTAFLAGNVVETDFEEPVFAASSTFEKGGVKVAVIGQAFPYTPIANPRWMMPKWSFGIREDEIRKNVAAARRDGAEIVVLLSHNGFNLDRKLATRVEGIDFILTAHTHDALPVPIQVEKTFLIASGSHGKFLTRLDVEVADGRLAGFDYALIPVLSDVIAPDPDMARLIGDIRAPHEAMLATELARTEALLYRRGSFAGTLDDLICSAMLAERDAEICFSPGFRWGASLLPEAPITWEDVYNATAITYPACYRMQLSGAAIKAILEDVADNAFHPDPYYRQGGDMVRVGGMSYAINPEQAMGRRISELTLARTGAPLEDGATYAVAGWGSVNEGVEGPPIWDVVAHHLQRAKVVRAEPSGRVKVVRG